MEHKTFNLIETKADESGSFTALASVFGNVDHVGDRMMPGAFTKTLERWRKSGDPIPVILSHEWADPNYVVGKADPRAVFEDERGLVVQGQLDLENPVAKQVHKLLKDRLLKGWSFGYTVPKGGQKRKKDANEVTEVDLIEVGPTLKGANPEAQLQEIKSAITSDTSAMSPRTMADRINAMADQMASANPPDSKTMVAEMRAMAEGMAGAMSAEPEKTSEEEKAIEDAVGKEPSEATPRAQDPLSKDHDHLAFELTTAGIDMAEPPKVKKEPPPEIASLAELERQFHDLMLETLIGSENL